MTSPQGKYSRRVGKRNPQILRAGKNFALIIAGWDHGWFFARLAATSEMHFLPLFFYCQFLRNFATATLEEDIEEGGS